MRRSYTHFCACGKALDARLRALGAARFALRADVNREDWRAVDAWIDAAVSALAALPLKPYGKTAGAEPLVSCELYIYEGCQCSSSSCTYS